MFYEILGWILIFLTFGILFYLFYSEFFGRKYSKNKKTLLKFLENNKLPLGEKLFRITHRNFDNGTLYLWYDNKISFHDKKGEILINCPNLDYIERKLNKNIYDILKIESDKIIDVLSN